MEALTTCESCGKEYLAKYNRCPDCGKLTFHAFSDNEYEYFNTFKQAKKQFNEWKKKYGWARMYELWERGGDTEDGDCLASFGGWPE